MDTEDSDEESDKIEKIIAMIPEPIGTPVIFRSLGFRNVQLSPFLLSEKLDNIYDEVSQTFETNIKDPEFSLLGFTSYFFRGDDYEDKYAKPYRSLFLRTCSPDDEKINYSHLNQLKKNSLTVFLKFKLFHRDEIPDEYISHISLCYGYRDMITHEKEIFVEGM